MRKETSFSIFWKGNFVFYFLERKFRFLFFGKEISFSIFWKGNFVFYFLERKLRFIPPGLYYTFLVKSNTILVYAYTKSV